MGIFDGCLLASDIDGTLIDNGFLPPRNLEKISYFVKEGGVFSISTGRSIEAVQQVFRTLDRRLVGPSVVLNGGMIYDFSTDAVLYETLLSDRGKRFPADISRRYGQVGIEVHAGGKTYVAARTEETNLHERYEELAPHFVRLEQINGLSWNKVLFCVGQDEELRKTLRREAEAFSETDSAFFDTSAEIDGVKRLYFEQLPSGTSKGEALARLRTAARVKKGGLFAVGDYYNDVPMFEAADISAVTAGAPEDLKQKVNFVSSACREGAVADFIDYLANFVG